MTKTFREVIRDIKIGEVWENEFKIIEHYFDGIKISHKEEKKSSPAMFFADKYDFKLQRKQYTFLEALSAFEKGMEIESVASGSIYKTHNDGYKWTYLYNGERAEGWEYEEEEIEFTYSQIRGMWYINR